MKNVTNLLEQKEKEFAVLMDQEKELQQQLSELNAKHSGSESELAESEKLGLADRFKKALRIKKDLSKEIEDTEDTHKFITKKIKDQKEKNSKELTAAARIAFEQDKKEYYESTGEDLEKIDALLSEALEIYQSLANDSKEQFDKGFNLTQKIARFAGDQDRQTIQYLGQFADFSIRVPELDNYFIRKGQQQR